MIDEDLRKIFRAAQKNFNVSKKEVAEHVVVYVMALQHWLESNPDKEGEVEFNIQTIRFSLRKIRRALRLDMARKLFQIPREGISCKKGCPWCCRLEPHISSYEAKLLLPYFEDSEKWTDFHLDPYSYCPWLVEGLCSIYEHRPLACRQHNSIASPDGCRDMMNFEFSTSLESMIALSAYYSSEVLEDYEWAYGPITVMMRHWSMK